MLTPHTPQELAEALAAAAARGQTIRFGGAFSKNGMAGPLEPATATISTACLQRVLQYEPDDLTVSVEAGMKWCDFLATLAAHRQTVPLDPPFSESSTVGGVVAANLSGPRRRLYGTARDFVIGMHFATLQGRLVQSGGMVVKNVAGLDMAKLMIGSFGTLAAIAVVNFKVIPEVPVERSFLLSFRTAAEACAARNTLQRGCLQPAAMDILSPAVSAVLGNSGFLLALRAGGNEAAVSRFERELGKMGSDGIALEGGQHEALWNYVQEYTPGFLGRNPTGVVVRISCTLKETEEVLASLDVSAIARAGSGVVYGYFGDVEQAAGWCAASAGRKRRFVIEFAPEDRKRGLDLWPAPGDDFKIMQRVKNLFDPQGLLNRGRLYGRI